MKLQGKTVLVTGADGFIGSHLAQQAVAEGAKVRALAHYNSFNSWGWLDTLDSETLHNIEVVTGDVRDPRCVKEVMEGIDIAYHLAALIAIPYSYKSPASFVDTNINGTLNVLEAARELDIERLLITSTSEVYGTAQYVPIDEKHPFQAQSPYAASKIGADRLAEAYCRCYDVPITIVRPFNTYGPRQSARAIIPTIIVQLLSGKKSIKLGNLSPTRDLNFVKDTANGFIEISLARRAIGEELNIATQHEISMKQLAEEIIRQINPLATIELDTQRIRPEKSEVQRLLGSNKKIVEMTNWKPEFDLARGLEETISWFGDERNRSRYKANVYNV